MSEDTQRNFRSVYYEKVGFRGVEEKKSLEILLKDDKWDIEKLCTFCQRFPLPSMYRILVWKVLLGSLTPAIKSPFVESGILPPHQETHPEVMVYRREQYNDVYHALEVIRLINESTPKTDVFFYMYQLETGKLSRSQKYTMDAEDELFLAIAGTMEEMVDDDVDCYWLIKSFVHHLDTRFRDSQQQLQKGFEHYLNIEDGRLVSHLKACSALEKLPYDLWFRKCFAGCLPPSTLQRIWDKLIPEDNTDPIVNKAIDLWHKHCGIPAHSL
ncbi:hypothetical protein GDO81_011786 [Engystomops pustulosus]|uniref:TBC1 domain family member 7 n=1 Tax=Engystomops pustulosus TaxID=76066 RepID=A0AAV7BGS0_ENGPU|nr:hypothetical protein GDO81_011786 [Engystomops pustulosus]